ncbi:MAG: GntR family transcriptional regulator [Egibacteraceae bacterium]
MSPKIEQSLPKYMQVANHIRNQIIKGELKPGDEVPSERQIVEEWGVSRPTATKALSALRVEGLVEAQQGSGTFVRAQPKIFGRATATCVLVQPAGIYARPTQRDPLFRCGTSIGRAAVALGLDLGTEAIRVSG